MDWQTAGAILLLALATAVIRHERTLYEIVKNASWEITMSNEKLKELRHNAEPDQLRPTRTPYTNATLRGPDASIGDLECELAVDPTIGQEGVVVTVSAWELDERQRALVAAGAHLRMSVWQHPIPPLALAIEAPYCNCGSGTIFVKNERAFACPNCGDRIQTGTYTSPQQIKELESSLTSAQKALKQAHEDFEAHPEQSGDETDPPQAA